MVQQRKISRVLDFEIAKDPFSGWNISRESTLTISFCTIDQKALGIQVLIQCNTPDALFYPLFRSKLIIKVWFDIIQSEHIHIIHSILPLFVGCLVILIFSFHNVITRDLLVIAIHLPDIARYF